MPVLVISPNEDVRHGLRERLAPLGEAIRAQTYRQGAVLAEQHWPSVAVIWSPPGADAEVVELIFQLRRLNRDVRIIVATPYFTNMGTAALVEHLQVDAYLLDTELDAIAEEAMGVPVIVERDPKPPTRHGGSSAACH
jgi:hypothetical protein